MGGNSDVYTITLNYASRFIIPEDDNITKVYYGVKGKIAIIYYGVENGPVVETAMDENGNAFTDYTVMYINTTKDYFLLFDYS